MEKLSVHDNNEILVSVVIPVKNGDYWLEKTLKSILSQKIDGRFEVIVIDSGSSDRSVEIIRQFPVRLIQIDPQSFNHGNTRNLGVRAAAGKFVLMTVQDAWPVDDFWMRRLLEGFDDEHVAAVCGRQIVPHDLDKNPVEWFRPISDPEIFRFKFSPLEFERLTPFAKRQVCGWDDVTAMYRKKVLEEIPFREVMFAEDALWAKDALLRGHTIVYNFHAQVYHYHLEEPAFTLRRMFTAFYHFYLYFGYKPSLIPNGAIRALKDVKLLWKESALSWSDRWRWFWYNLRMRRAINKAVTMFHLSLKNGDSALKEKHNELCGKVPQAIRPT